MSEASSAQLIQQAIDAVDRRVLELVDQARQRRERGRERRAELAAARAAGIGRRNAQKLRNLRSSDGNAVPVTDTTVAQKATTPNLSPATVTETVTTAERGTGTQHNARRRACTSARGENDV